MSSAATTGEAAAGPQTGLTRSVVRGSAWLMVNTAVMRLVALGTQVALGHLLTDADYGLYGMAMAVAAIVGVFRDGGVRQVLIQRHGEYERLAGPVFWMGAVFAVASGAALAALGPVVAKATGEPRMTELLLIVAAAQTVGALGAPLSAKLQIDMRFAAYSLLATVTGAVRYAGQVVLAVMGLGASAFVWPMVPAGILDLLVPLFLLREKPWKRRADVASWPGLFRSTGWVLAGAAGLAALNIGSSLVIGLFVAKEVVGVYYFAFQLVAQVGMLLGNNLNQVLFPAFSRIAGEAERKREAVVKVLRQVTLLASPACLGLAAVAGPLVRLIWQNKWDGAVTPIMIIGFVFPMNIILSVPLSVQQARGDFRGWALSLVGLSGVALGSAAWAAWATGTAEGITFWSGVATAGASLAYTAWCLRGSGVAVRRTLGAIAPGWGLSCAAAAGAVALDRALLSGAPALVRCIAAGCVFSGAFGLLVRGVVPSHLAEALSLLPRSVREPARAMLRLRG